jgi:hypothetical protein
VSEPVESSLRHLAIVHDSVWDGIERFLRARGLCLFPVPGCDVPTYGIGVSDGLMKLAKEKR